MEYVPTTNLTEETASRPVGSGIEMTVRMSSDKSGETEKESDRRQSQEVEVGLDN